ncbi:hypothetical protein ACIGGF_16220 [Rhodococcus sp. NPDC078407]|uniref:hypothetical protein n=1 Tax=Rhodococcus sp. NPDC078407 TaxID=3364509 RepID=UPI0037C55EF1
MTPHRTGRDLAEVVPLFGRRGSRATTADLADDVEPTAESSVERLMPHGIEPATPDASEELAALTASKPIAQLRSLLGWLGTSRPITGRGFRGQGRFASWRTPSAWSWMGVHRGRDRCSRSQG